ncbi:MAG TPA: transposase, partial [Pyrinomonadaceae bacterium]
RAPSVKNIMKNELKGWHSRGYLPHFDVGEIPQFITFRLFDSLPQVVLTKWKAELEREKSLEAEIVLRRRIETYLDQSFGKCYLKQEQVADLVQNALLFFDDERYRLLAWVVMPNHIHFLATPLEKQSLSNIVQSLKIFTAKEANKLLNRQGKFWQSDYFDRYIRDYEHFTKVVSYIENNPVKARLCQSKSEWRFGSAYFFKTNS